MTPEYVKSREDAFTYHVENALGAGDSDHPAAVVEGQFSNDGTPLFSGQTTFDRCQHRICRQWNALSPAK